MHTDFSHENKSSALFLLVHDIDCVVVSLPKLQRTHVLQLLDDAGGKGVSNILLSFFKRR